MAYVYVDFVSVYIDTFSISSTRREGLSEGLEEGLEENLEEDLKEGLEKGLEEGLENLPLYAYTD